MQTDSALAHMPYMTDKLLIQNQSWSRHYHV